MRMLHLGLAVAVLVGCAFSAEAAAKAKAKKGKNGLHGTVTAVSIKDKDSGTITVQVNQGKKKKNQNNPAAPVEKTFNITSATAFQTVQHVKGQKGQVETAAATFKDVAKGNHVLIQANGDTAETVKIVKGKKK
jgi:hypothetical protein